MNNKISIICEIASAHEGSIVALKKMLDKAEDAGADWVKVQVFQYKELVAKDNNKFNYLMRPSGQKTGHVCLRIQRNFSCKMAMRIEYQSLDVFSDICLALLVFLFQNEIHLSLSLWLQE